jgi:23S rRNA (guanosine2251-2'-O)-methyltransferase
MANHRRNTEKTSSAARNTHGRKSMPAKANSPGASTREGWIWGRHAVLAALKNPRRQTISLHVSRNTLSELDENSAKTAQIQTPRELASLVPDSAVHQGFVLKASALEPESINAVQDPTHGLLLVLDQITDPQNVGALMRSATAFGARAIIMQDRKSPPLFGALCKASVGCSETLPHIRVTNIANTLIELRKAGRTVIGLAGEGLHTLSQCVADHAGPGLILVMGAEGTGLRPRVAEHCDYLARIPMGPKAESLNVSAAAAVALYECSRHDPRINPKD